MDENKYALIIIDMQNDFVLPGAPLCIAGAVETVPMVKRLLEFFRSKDFPVFHVVREYRADGSDIEFTRIDLFNRKKGFVVPGTNGCEIVEELTPAEGEYRIVKNRYSAFMNTELDLMLRRLGIRDIVVSGTQYPVCVRATIFDAIAYDYRVVNITDATSAQTRDVAEANIFDIRNAGAECMTLDEFLNGFIGHGSSTGAKRYNKLIKDCKIRAAEPGDYNDIFELLEQLWPGDKLDFNRAYEMFKKNYNSDYKRLICAQCRDKVIGFCSLTMKNSLWKQGLCGNIDELVISEEYRGHGLGRKMMEAITGIAVSEGCVQIELDSAFHRERAHGFYRDLGFNPRAWLFTKSLH